MGSVPQAGVYAFEGPDGGIYIGSSADLRKREVFHWSLLRRGKHHATRLQQIYDTHGTTALTYRVLEYTTADQASVVEQRYLDELFASRPREMIYNNTPSANGATGRIVSEATRQKLSAAKKGRRKSDETRRRMSEGRKGMKFAADHVQNIALAKSGGKTYTIIAPDGTEYHDVINVTAFARKHGLLRSGLTHVLAGKARSHRGWVIIPQHTQKG